LTPFEYIGTKASTENERCPATPPGASGNMFGLAKKCEYCKREIDKGREISENVEVYGRTDKPKKHFCSEQHLELYKKRTEQLMKTRRPNVCMKCLR